MDELPSVMMFLTKQKTAGISSKNEQKSQSYFVESTVHKGSDWQRMGQRMGLIGSGWLAADDDIETEDNNKFQCGE